MNEISLQLQVLGLHKDVKSVLEEKSKEGIRNLPEPLKVTLATEEADDILDKLAVSFEEKEDWDKEDLLNMAACYFVMAMIEEVLDEFDYDEETNKKE